MNIEGRTLQFPGSPDTDPMIRVDLKYLVTSRSAFTHRYLNFRRDVSSHNQSPCYGDMLSQQLRRVEGVGDVTITHYGCKVGIGAMYDIRDMNRKVRKAVEFTLASSVPWIVVRGHDRLNWAYLFGAALLQNRHNHIDVRRTPDPQGLTELGERLRAGLSSKSESNNHGVRMFNDFRAFMTASGDQDWPTLDAEFDALVTEVVGRRDLTIEWD